MKKELIIGIMFAGVLVIAVFFIFNDVDNSTYFEKESGSLPECSSVLYTEAFVEIDKINEITPLGNTEPPGHTIPTNHMYVNLFQQGTQKTTLPLYAPADIWITDIVSSTGFLDPEDYTIRFSVCKDVIGYFNHVKKLSPEMQAILDNNKCQDFGVGSSDRCEVKVFEPVESGAHIGEVGALQGNFDFGTYDFRTTHDFINPERYADRTLHIECGFDYYIPELKEQFIGLLEEESEGNCGKTNYDILGTLQGNWFNGDTTEVSPETWNQHLYIGYDNVDPSLAVISVGGVFVDEPTKWLFTPKESGTTNLVPEKVRTGEIIYCYEKTEDAPDYRYRGSESGKILVQLITNEKIKIEYQNKNCVEDLKFTNNAKIYER